MYDVSARDTFYWTLFPICNSLAWLLVFLTFAFLEFSFPFFCFSSRIGPMNAQMKIRKVSVRTSHTQRTARASPVQVNTRFATEIVSTALSASSLFVVNIAFFGISVLSLLTIWWLSLGLYPFFS